MTSVLLMGHGSPDRAANEELLELRGLVAERLAQPVALGVLEFARPDLPSLAEAFGLLDRTRPAAAQPLVLFEGLHGRTDMPREAEQAVLALGLDLRVGTPFGCDKALVDLALSRVRSVGPREGDVLLFVGRGSSQRSALDQTDDVARMVASRAGLPHVVCHAGISRPDPAEGVRLAAPGARRVIVLPWLIHTGVLVERVHAVTGAAAVEVGVEAVQLPHIGNDPVLVEVIAGRLEGML